MDIEDLANELLGQGKLSKSDTLSLLKTHRKNPHNYVEKLIGSESPEVGDKRNFYYVRGELDAREMLAIRAINEGAEFISRYTVDYVDPAAKKVYVSGMALIRKSQHGTETGH